MRLLATVRDKTIERKNEILLTLKHYGNLWNNAFKMTTHVMY